MSVPSVGHEAADSHGHGGCAGVGAGKLAKERDGGFAGTVGFCGSVVGCVGNPFGFEWSRTILHRH